MTPNCPVPLGVMARTYVLDTNVLIADPEAPGRFQEHDVAIPLTVVEELDKLKTRPDETGASARRVRCGGARRPRRCRVVSSVHIRARSSSPSAAAPTRCSAT